MLPPGRAFLTKLGEVRGADIELNEAALPFASGQEVDMHLVCAKLCATVANFSKVQ